jgi:hypothetical protein
MQEVCLLVHHVVPTVTGDTREYGVGGVEGGDDVSYLVGEDAGLEGHQTKAQVRGGQIQGIGSGRLLLSCLKVSLDHRMDNVVPIIDLLLIRQAGLRCKTDTGNNNGVDGMDQRSRAKRCRRKSVHHRVQRRCEALVLVRKVEGRRKPDPQVSPRIIGGHTPDVMGVGGVRLGRPTTYRNGGGGEPGGGGATNFGIIRFIVPQGNCVAGEEIAEDIGSFLKAGLGRREGKHVVSVASTRNGRAAWRRGGAQADGVSALGPFTEEHIKPYVKAEGRGRVPLAETSTKMIRRREARWQDHGRLCLVVKIAKHTYAAFGEVDTAGGDFATPKLDTVISTADVHQEEVELLIIDMIKGVLHRLAEDPEGLLDTVIEEEAKLRVMQYSLPSRLGGVFMHGRLDAVVEAFGVELHWVLQQGDRTAILERRFGHSLAERLEEAKGHGFGDDPVDPNAFKESQECRDDLLGGCFKQGGGEARRPGP